MKRIRDKEIPNLELSRDIYKKDRAAGMKPRTAKERFHEWKVAKTNDEVNQLHAENAVIPKILEEFHISPQLGNSNSNDASSASKSIKNYSSKLIVKRKYEDIFSEDMECWNSTNLIQECLKNLSESMAAIARALNTANENFFKYNTRVYSATEFFTELEKHGVPDDKLLDAAKFRRANNDIADTFFGCPDRLKQLWLERNGF